MEEKNKKRAQKEQFLDKKIKQLEEEKGKYLSGWQRSQADFLNYKKEEAERFKKMVDFEKEEWILELLNVLNLFEKAESGIQEQDSKHSVIEGFVQIKKYFEDFLIKQGVKEIKSEVGKIFNPHFEEVIETVEDNEKEEGTIVDIIQKGYLFKERVIRPAHVRVTKKSINNNNNN
ncbi:MAG: nucleotide exchange factor GrpE [Candidatus Parcubacteria bacterium]|nr:nucleotide exchange factor GrpE [Candidatus Parcubacteria bacterium]